MKCCPRLGFSILVGPDLQASSPALKAIVDVPDAAALADPLAKFQQDVSPPTDDRPFFFNQLRITYPQAVLLAMQAPTAGVIAVARVVPGQVVQPQDIVFQYLQRSMYQKE